MIHREILFNLVQGFQCNLTTSQCELGLIGRYPDKKKSKQNQESISIRKELAK